MDVDLSPKLAKKLYGGDGGSYYTWSPSELPMLREGNIGAAKLALEKNGFALPRYSDSAKVAYVLQGSGTAGIVLPEAEEKVIAIKKGDAIALPFGVVTWWYNSDDTELVVLFMGDTSKAHKVGEFTDFYLTGSNGIFTGFSTEFVGRAWDLEDTKAKALVASQSGSGIVKLKEGVSMPKPKKEDREGMALNCEEAPLDVDIKRGGRVVVLNTKNLPLVGEVGLGADLVRLDGSAMCSPGFSCDSALQVTYIVKGSGRVQVVGVDGRRVLDTTLKAGCLFIVPRFFVVSKICDPVGMEWFSIISTPKEFSIVWNSGTIPWQKQGMETENLMSFDLYQGPGIPDVLSDPSKEAILENTAVASAANDLNSSSSDTNEVPFNKEAMDVDLSPQLAKKLYGGDGGSYYTWSPSELPMLREGNIGAAKIALEKNGLALPRYSDSAKVAYVLQGSGTAGIVLPEAEEKVIAIKKGDAIALPFGVVTWWYNSDDTELVVLFMGDTSKAHKVGEFTDFYLTGSNGIFTGFSTEFVGRAWDLEEDKAKALVASLSGSGIVKLKEGVSMPEPKKEDREGMALNCEEAPLDVDIKGGGRVVVLNTKNLPLVGEVGLGADLVRLDGSAMCSPGFSCDSALQVTYIVKGSGRVQVVGVDGRRVLDTTLKAGCLFIVPRFFVVSKIGDPVGMEWFSIISTPNPIFSHLAGRTSVWKALSPEVLQASFNVAPEVEKHFSSKRTADAIFFPPPN
ncbi:hypothetical protein HHK36_010923 [Tetracentron sinense]|uniref:Cupin type-1 domain-containing protein n=1 Tax=Tetracentron sinense TaxID=13715 RepID=A0A834ZHS3_TETSI|nr:hypothetical protein HHK36_010923 [Tetracentron sinense]